jgi:hypothetical protein
MTKSEYKAKIEAYFKRANYAQAKIAYEKINAEWSRDCAELETFVKAQGPQARHANGLTADYVRDMPEYVSGEQAKMFNGIFTRVFKREHVADIQATRQAKADDHKARWAALCATV